MVDSWRNVAAVLLVRYGLRLATDAAKVEITSAIARAWCARQRGPTMAEQVMRAARGQPPIRDDAW